MKKGKSAQGPGRPRCFDVEEALEKALFLFWEQGYEGTSLTDLTTAMGINRPSLYTAFGNKESLFRKVVEKYCGHPSGWTQEFIETPVARDAIEQKLLSIAAGSGNEWPQGCLLVRGALACSEESSSIQKELSARRAANEALICQRLERARTEGELPPESEPSDLARYFATIMHGFSVQAIGGASSEELMRVVELAMKAWPDKQKLLLAR